MKINLFFFISDFNFGGASNSIFNFLNKVDKKKFKIFMIFIGSSNYKKILPKTINVINVKTYSKKFSTITSFFLRKIANLKLIILGHGNLKNKLKQLTKNLNLEKKVIFKGWVKNPDKYLKKSKLFVLSSVYEGLGNVLLDAINFDTPCVSTNCPSGPDEILLNGRGGYLVRPNSPHELAQKMLYAIDNYETSNNKNKIAKSKLNRFLIKQNSTYYFNHLLTFFNDKK